MSPVCLTMLVPPQAQDRLIDFLCAPGAVPAEFSMHPVSARGPLVRMRRGDEQVQGYAQRTEVKLILERADCEALIAPLRALLAGVDGGYWITAVERFEPFGAA
ncbi:MAG: DUF3240 family protein, partial [Burkholderiales bacterium]|nr:DUF3240 family protein [Burkholderiales bacterium]